MGGERVPDSQDWWVVASQAKLPDRKRGGGAGAAASSRLLVQLGVWAGEQEPNLCHRKAYLPVVMRWGAGELWGAGGRCGINLLAPPSSTRIGEMPLEGWANLCRRLGAQALRGPLKQDPHVRAEGVSANTVGMAVATRVMGVSMRLLKRAREPGGLVPHPLANSALA